ncbi:ankyrin [Backusella circina FSU 941]|nr:ankyrin [Backusella circina FSU 941]
MTAVVHESSQHASKPCTSASCCSPSRLWKSAQQIIQKDNKEEFKKLIQKNGPENVLRVLLTCRLSNNPLVYNRTSFMIDRRMIESRKFGKSATDLNALEIALYQKKQEAALAILFFLKSNASEKECHRFLNHQDGQGNTALHLAAFWGMSKLVRLMLEMGSDPFLRNTRKLRPTDCTTHSESIQLLEKRMNTTNSPQPVVQQQELSPLNTAVVTERPSFLLKKAYRAIDARSPSPMLASPDHYFNGTNNLIPLPEDKKKIAIHDYTTHDRVSVSPLSFSSSSSSSSFSSLSSLEEHHSSALEWTPPASPVHIREPSVEKEWMLMERPGCFPRMKKEDEQPPVFIKPATPPITTTTTTMITKKNVELMDEIKSPVVVPKEKKLRQVRFDPMIVLIEACIRGDKNEMIDIIKECQNNPNLKSGVNEINNRSLLHIALLHKKEDLVEYLVNEVQVDINHGDNDGWTSLHYAAALGLWRSLEFLTSLPHCNLNARTNDGLEAKDCSKTDSERKLYTLIINRTLRRIKAKSCVVNKRK